MSKGIFSRFFDDRRGNIIMIYAIALPVVIFAVGFAIDFGRAAQLRTKLNAAADAAALTALTPTMMAQSNATAQAAAISMFNGQVSGLVGLASGQTSVTVTITNPNNNILNRQVSVCYSAAESTIFAGILGTSALAMGNCANAQVQLPPNINFYLLLDNSPSMLLPATQTGINSMISLTSYQDGSAGCAFACHQAATNNADTTGNSCVNGNAPVYVGNDGQTPATNYYYCTTTKGSTCSNGTSPSTIVYNNVTYYYCTVGAQIDNYQMARNNNIALRIDEVSSAVTTLMSTAQTTSQSSLYSTKPVYQFEANTIDNYATSQTGFTNIMGMTPNYITGWATASSNFGVMGMYSNNNNCTSAACTAGVSSSDANTSYDNAMSNANTQMPTPGNGTNAIGDTPQEVLFIVTDGVEDEMSGSTRLEQPINYGTSTNYCTTIKNRGIRIAILYTEYLPVATDSWYNSHIAPIQTDIAPALQACASPGLFYNAAIGANLSTALSSLFQAVVQSSNLTQ